MTPFSYEKTKCMCDALDHALILVKQGNNYGLCSGIDEAWEIKKCTYGEAEYLHTWINRMVGGFTFMDANKNPSTFMVSAYDRWLRRKHWVDWMKLHLMETSECPNKFEKQIAPLKQSLSSLPPVL